MRCERESTASRIWRAAERVADSMSAWAESSADEEGEDEEGVEEEGVEEEGVEEGEGEERERAWGTLSIKTGREFEDGSRRRERRGERADLAKGVAVARVCARRRRETGLYLQKRRCREGEG